MGERRELDLDDGSERSLVVNGISPIMRGAAGGNPMLPSFPLGSVRGIPFTGISTNPPVVDTWWPFAENVALPLPVSTRDFEREDDRP